MENKSKGDWKRWCAITYIVICTFDFVMVPMWYGVTRPHFSEVVQYIPDGDIALQMEYLRILTDHHSPFTLNGGGLFHLAFGALLTGSAITNNRENDHTDEN